MWAWVVGGFGWGGGVFWFECFWLVFLVWLGCDCWFGCCLVGVVVLGAVSGATLDISVVVWFCSVGWDSVVVSVLVVLVVHIV